VWGERLKLDPACIQDAISQRWVIYSKEERATCHHHHPHKSTASTRCSLAGTSHRNGCRVSKQPSVRLQSIATSGWMVVQLMRAPCLTCSLIRPTTAWLGALCYKLDGHRFESRMRWTFLNLLNPSSRTMTLGPSQPLTEMSTEIFLGIKSGRRVGLTNLPPSMSRMSENVGASTSRNPKGLHGLYREIFTFTAWLTVQYHCSPFYLPAFC
jgi:hypothetical protein